MSDTISDSRDGRKAAIVDQDGLGVSCALSRFPAALDPVSLADHRSRHNGGCREPTETPNYQPSDHEADAADAMVDTDVYTYVLRY